jgi:hypothetical protein
MATVSTSEVFPGFSKVYWLHEPGGSRAFRGDIPLSVDDAFAVTRAEKMVGHVEVRWTMGRAVPSDVIWATIAAPVILSDRAIGILRGGEFSGWLTYPVELLGKDGMPIPNYHGLAVRGRCGPIEQSRSTKIDRIYPGGIFPVLKGMYFDPLTWDGSDVFMPSSNVGFILVVEKMKRAFETARIKNVEFTPLDEAELQKVF